MGKITACKMLVKLTIGDINPGPVQSFQKKIINSFNAQQQQHLQQQQYLQQQQMNPYYKEKVETEKKNHLKVETECRDLEELSFSLANPANPDQLAEPIGLTTLTGSSLLDSFDVEMETSPDDVLECSSRDVEESDCQLKALVQSYQVIKITLIKVSYFKYKVFTSTLIITNTVIVTELLPAVKSKIIVSI